MTKSITSEIAQTKVAPGFVGVWWLAQAGFVFKAHDGTVVYLDPYLTDIVEKTFGFKRLSLAPISADEVRADWLISSHEHLDHLDTDALPVIARNNPRCRFAGSESCQPVYAECGIEKPRTLCLLPGTTHNFGPFTIRTAKADHGDLSPSALSLLFEFGPVRILFTGDTAFRPDWLGPLCEPAPDVLLPCINGQFGNLDPLQAAQLTAIVKPQVVVPCHFWMFMEHGGDPAAFVAACKKECPAVAVRLLSPGEGMIVSPSTVTRL